MLQFSSRGNCLFNICLAFNTSEETKFKGKFEFACFSMFLPAERERLQQHCSSTAAAGWNKSAEKISADQNWQNNVSEKHEV